MWCDYFNQNFFIKKIFEVVPDLKSVTILDVHFGVTSNRLKMFIKMSELVDYPPKKWGEPGLYTFYIELDFFDISNVHIANYNDMQELSDIQITMENELIRFSSTGAIDMDFNAKAGVIQSIKIYY
ncbi:MAG: hypothetical protein HFK00_08175 [Oscillospiraceae bacterium]|nr:hypothetical protein [Oscillospiraceae bacterium]